MYTQHPILTEKHRIVDIFADLLKKKTEMMGHLIIRKIMHPRGGDAVTMQSGVHYFSNN